MVVVCHRCGGIYREMGELDSLCYVCHRCRKEHLQDLYNQPSEAED